MDIISSPEWAKQRIALVIKEVKYNNGKIKNVMCSDQFVKIMSKISNYIRYDVISMNDNSTFKVPAPMELDLDTFLI
jgi:hypothetical protein